MSGLQARGIRLHLRACPLKSIDRKRDEYDNLHPPPTSVHFCNFKWVCFGGGSCSAHAASRSISEDFDAIKKSPFLSLAEGQEKGVISSGAKLFGSRNGCLIEGDDVAQNSENGSPIGW
jgi:hypothetical protein